MWKTNTIEEMEETAKEQADGWSSKRIKGQWLGVHWTGSEYRYFWGQHQVRREVAERVRLSEA